MKITQYNDKNERLILIAMIVDSIVLGKIAAKWQSKLFKSKYANTVASWCISYYEKYNKAPMQRIENLYQNWSAKTKDKDTIAIVEKFLDSLNNEYKELKHECNSDFIIDLAGRHFNKVKLQKLVDEIESDIQADDIDIAKTKITDFNQIEMGTGEGINVFQDDEALKRIFTDDTEALIKYPGALGEFFGNHLERDGFISFLGPDKSGKTFWLLDVAYRAMLQRRKVAFFEAGDMTETQIMRRFAIRNSKRPFRAGIVKYPISIKRRKKQKYAKVRLKNKKFTKGLSYKTAKQSNIDLMENRIHSDKPYLKLSCHPNDSLTVTQIESIVKAWSRANWVPDIIIIDYADILDMTYNNVEGRDAINKTWKRLRALSQKLHCLVVTATQSNSKSYEAELIRKKNFSDDKRKNAHVTGMIGINCTSEEKARGITRLNWVVLREDEYLESKCVHTAGCKKIGNPAIKSCF